MICRSHLRPSQITGLSSSCRRIPLPRACYRSIVTFRSRPTKQPSQGQRAPEYIPHKIGIPQTYLWSRRSSSAAASPTTPPPPSPDSSALEKPDFLDEAESQIWDLLARAFSPNELDVRDISGGCGSMYGIDISSERFRGAGMLQQQRMVNAVLGDMMKGWHGVQLKTRIP